VARNFNLSFAVGAVHKHFCSSFLDGKILTTARAVEMNIHSGRIIGNSHSTATLIPAVVASRNSHGNGDCDQNPDRYREGDSNRHSNSTTAPNSNSHSIGHIYSDGYRYANEAPTATSTPTVALSCGRRSVSSWVPTES
jgi:hypothetical protein